MLLEGGGTINGAFLKADLIDEIGLLVYPGLDGLAGIPSIFEYHGTSANELPAVGRSPRLLSVETHSAGIVWMTTTLLDRLTHDCHIVATGNDSHRYRHSSEVAGQRIEAREASRKRRAPTTDDLT